VPERSVAEDVPFAPLVWLFFTAGLLGLLSVVLPHDPAVQPLVVVGLSAGALVISAGLLAIRRRGLGLTGVSVLLAVATILTAAAIWATGGPPNATSGLYMWICLYGAYVLPQRRAIDHAVICAASYLLVTALDPPAYPPVAHLATTIAALVGATLIVSVLRARLLATMARLEVAARTDPLTGLANRRHFEAELERELERTRRDGSPLTVVFADLDRFKFVNDTHGHLAGDRLLQFVGQVLVEQSRAIDVPARTGGEEFAILLPDTTLAEGVAVAERLRREIERRLEDRRPRITLSLGAACTEQVGQTSSALCRSADRALYEAKTQGRNRTVAAERVALTAVA
jgi:diguanylate cyclase (GGDEF)-like protein